MPTVCSIPWMDGGSNLRGEESTTRSRAAMGIREGSQGAEGEGAGLSVGDVMFRDLRGT